jgi:hypothetical protein
MFGVGFERGERRDPARTLEQLIAERAHGADLLEVGYRKRGGNPLADHLWVWDRLAEAGIRLVGIGVSDSHGGPDQRWRTMPNNFVSWIEAPSPGKPDLIAGLRAGRVYFGDIVLFDGRVDLSTRSGARMGDTVVTQSEAVEVDLAIDGLSAGDRIDVVEARGRTASHSATGRSFRSTHRVALPAEQDGLVRLEVYTRDGREKVFSNPIWFVRPDRAGESGGASGPLRSRAAPG